MSVVKPARAFPLFSSVDDVGDVTSIHSAQCRETCAFDAETQWHHRQLMTIESDHDVLLDLIELAVTWPELEYSETPTISPAHWIPFVESHRWVDSQRVERIFSVATDIAMTAARASRRPSLGSDCRFGENDDPPRVATSTIPVTRRDRADLGPGAVDHDGWARTRLVVDQCSSGSGNEVELAQGWSGRTVARRRR